MLAMIGQLLSFCLDIYMLIIILGVVISWLIAFEVINVKNDKAANLVRLIDRLTAPVYAPLRKYIPAIGGIDITPIIVIFAIALIQNKLIPIIFY